MLPLEDQVLLNDALHGMSVDPAVIAEIMTLLDTRADTLTTARDDMAPVPASWFGGSSTGGHRLATNANLARDAVIDELENMVKGLRAYAQEIAAFRNDVESTEAGIAAHLTAVQRTAECTTVPTIGAGQCGAPTGGDR